MNNHRPLISFITLALITMTLPVVSTWQFINNAMAETEEIKTTPAAKEEATISKAAEGKQFQDWILKCGGDGLKDDQCYIIQTVFIKESGLRLLEVAAGYLGPDGSPWMFFVMPLGIFLPAGMAFNIDGGDEIKQPIRICLPDGCKASVALEDKLLAVLKEGSKVRVAFLDGNTQKQITVDISLKGFTDAYSALATDKR